MHSLLLTLSLVSSVLANDCNTVLAVYKAMGGVPKTSNGCALNGVFASGKTVTDIVWTFEGLKGQIPKEIGNLKKLKYLQLSNNQLTGPIPPEMGNLSNLLQFEIDNNQLSGQIPKELGKLTKVFVFRLYGNKLTGPIPKELAQLKDLDQLALGMNQLTGSIPIEFEKFTKLQFLTLRGNQLSGPIPKELGKLVKLSWLGLDNNKRSGVIPNEIGNLKNLERVYFNFNQLTGAPSSLSLLTKIAKDSLVLFPNPMSSIPYDIFAKNPAAVLSPTNWTNLLQIPVSLKKRQLTSSLKVDELYRLCPLNDVTNKDVVAGCVAGIYNKFCLNLSNLGNCQSAYDQVIAQSVFKPLGVCAAWKSGMTSPDCTGAISRFSVKLEYIVLGSQNARDFAFTVLGSKKYAPCVTTSTVTCKW